MQINTHGCRFLLRQGQAFLPVLCKSRANPAECGIPDSRDNYLLRDDPDIFREAAALAGVYQEQFPIAAYFCRTYNLFETLASCEVLTFFFHLPI